MIVVVRIFLIVISVFVLSNNATAQEYTLEDAVSRGLEANPQLDSRLKILEGAQLLVGAARGEFLPTVSYINTTSKLTNSGDVGSSDDLSRENSSHGIRATQNIFSGFAILNNYEKTKLSAALREAQYRQSALDLISNIQLQFLQLIKSRSDMATVRASMSRIETQLAAAKAFTRVGMAPYLNVLQNEVEYARVKQDEIVVRNAIRNHEVALNKLLGFDPDAKISYIGDLYSYSAVIPFTEQEAVQTALKNRPDIEAANKNIEISLKQHDIDLANFLPKIFLQYDNMASSTDYKDTRYKDYDRKYWSLSLNLSWELFDGFNSTYTSLASKKQVEALKREYESIIAEAHAEVIKSLLEVQSSSDLIKATRAALEAASESYAMASKRYQTNTGTITELLDAQFKLTRAEADVNQALASFHIARSKLFYNLGLKNPGLL